MVKEKDNETKKLIYQTEQKLLNSHDILNGLVWGLEDTTGTYDDANNKINKALMAKAKEIGITKHELNSNLKDFNISEMVQAINICQVC